MGSPISSAIRSAAARAATRRGCSIRILDPAASQVLSSKANGTMVVLPAPGSAQRTAALARSKLRTISESTASIGRPVGRQDVNIGTPYNPSLWNNKLWICNVHLLIIGAGEIPDEKNTDCDWFMRTGGVFPASPT